MTRLPASEVICFGCQREAGHYYWLALDDYRLRLDASEFNPEVPELLRCTDGHTSDLRRRVAQKNAYREQEGMDTEPSPLVTLPDDTRQGSAKLTVHGGWTYLGWWDYTIDRRPGSNSGLLVKGELTFDRMRTLALALFGDRAEIRCVQ